MQRIVRDIYEQLVFDECIGGQIPLKPYRDTVGKLTIGVGRNLDDKGISHDEATSMLVNDVLQWRLQVAQHFPWTSGWSEPRLGVLLNMTHNMGIQRVLEFRKFLAAAQAGDWETAATEMLDSAWEKQVGPRAHRLAEQLKKDVWQ
jgi:lysozyme